MLLRVLGALIVSAWAVPLLARPASDSLVYAAFAKQLRKRLTEEQVQSILSKLPEGCKVFGFDIGDYSGDKNDDLVFSARSDENLRKEVGVYYFLNRGARFDLVKYTVKKYLSEPVEIGFSIDQGICSVTQKIGEYHWHIEGCRLDDMVFHQVTEWETQRLPRGTGFSGIGYETTLNFRSFRTTELFYHASDVKQLLKQEYLTVPIYPSGLRLPRCVPESVGDSTSQSIVRGSSSWFGIDDASFFIAGRYDSTTVHLRVSIDDDKLLSSDSLESSDFLALAFDLSGKRKVDNYGTVRRTREDGILSMLLRMGNGGSVPPKLVMDAATTEDMEKIFWRVKCSVDQQTLGTSMVELEFPAEIFERCRNGSACGFAAMYHDVDNPERVEWATDISTTGLFDPDRPDTFGRLLFIQGNENFLFVDDIRLADVVRKMEHDGILH